MHPRAFEQFERLERDHWWFRGRQRVYLDLLERQLGAGVVGSALDLGTGVGGFLTGLARLAHSVVPVDSELDALRVCLRRADLPANVTAPVRSPCEKLPFAEASFALACLFDVIEHTDDDRACLVEVARVLEPGGRIAVSVPAYPALFSNNDRVAGHRRRYTRSSLRRVLEDSGFEVDRITHTNMFLLPVIVPVVLASKAWEKVFGRNDSAHTNLSWRVPRPLNALLYRAFAAEVGLSRRVDLALGHSILALARRPRRAGST